MQSKKIDIIVETDPEFSYVVGRNGLYWITNLKVRECAAGPHVYILGIGKRGHEIRGGFMVTKECFEEVCRQYLNQPLGYDADCEINTDGFCNTHQFVHLRERAEAMGVPAAAESGSRNQQPVRKPAKGRIR
jgi:hypothetical protein